jgi:hypothetical protein
MRAEDIHGLRMPEQRLVNQTGSVVSLLCALGTRGALSESAAVNLDPRPGSAFVRLPRLRSW